MTGKELLLEAIQGNPTERPAWVPFVGCHGGKLIDKTATEYLTSPELLEQGLRKAIELYRPDGLPIMFDLQVEAEILGCELRWADEVPPAVVSHPLVNGTIADLPEFSADKGRFPLVIEAMDKLVADLGDEVAFYGLICGPFTLALHLLGNDIFLQMFDDPEGVKAIINYCADIAIKSAQVYVDHGAAVIAAVDPMTSQISPEHFEEFVTPFVNRVFDAVREMGAFSSMFVCGDATRNLEVMCATHADNVSVDEQIPMDTLKGYCVPQGKSFGGNIRLTSVLLLGSEDDSRLEAIDIIERAQGDGFILAPGCDLPYNTPPANLVAVSAMVHDEYQRKIARETSQASEADAFEDVVPPTYDDHKEVIVDVITLDSTSCAPCQYMMEAVQHAANEAFVKVYINEHKIKDRRGIGMMVKLGVKNLPTICIDGDVAFASIIPDHKTLVRAFEKAALIKNI